MVKRHKGRFTKAVGVAHDPATPAPVAANGSDSPAAFDPASAAGVESDAVEKSETPDSSPRDAMLETVSPESLQFVPVALHARPVEDTPGLPAEPADVPPPPIDMPAAPHDTAPIAVEAAEPPLPARPIVVPQPLAEVPDAAVASKPMLDAVTEFTQANAALVAFLQSESRATLTHWRALAAAKSPADAIRLQVGEMQRAADASLTCFSVLAKRATRLAEAVRPR